MISLLHFDRKTQKSKEATPSLLRWRDESQSCSNAHGFYCRVIVTRDTQTTDPFNSLSVLIQLLADNGPSIWNLELVI